MFNQIIRPQWDHFGKLGKVKQSWAKSVDIRHSHLFHSMYSTKPFTCVAKAFSKWVLHEFTDETKVNLERSNTERTVFEGQLVLTYWPSNSVRSVRSYSYIWIWTSSYIYEYIYIWTSVANRMLNKWCELLTSTNTKCIQFFD